MKKIKINKLFILLLIILIIILLIIYYKNIIDNFSNQNTDYKEQITKKGLNSPGYKIDKNDYNGNGFNLYGYDKEGYDIDGYDINGFNREGYDRDNYNSRGLHKDGYDINGYNKLGYNKYGFDKTGYNYINRDSQYYDKNGFDRKGYDVNGYNKEGYDINGYTKNGYNKEGYDKEGYNIYGYNKEGVNKFGFDIDGNKIIKEDNDNILDKYFKESKKTFFNKYPFNINNDILNQKVKKITNDYVKTYDKLKLYYKSEDAVGDNTLYKEEQNKLDIYNNKLDKNKKYKCWLGNQENILNRNGQYSSYRKFDCTLNELYQKCKVLEKEDKCLLYIPPSCIKKYDSDKESYIDDCESNSSLEEVDKKNGKTIKQIIEIDKDGNKKTRDLKIKCPDDFECINLPENGGFGCPNENPIGKPLEPIKYTKEELKKFKESGNGYSMCENPKKIKGITNCYIGDNKNILNENPIFSPYIKYGCDLYNNYERCMSMPDNKYLVYDNYIGGLIEKDLEKNSNGKYILPDNTIYNKEEYCKTPPDNVGISGFGCYNKDGTDYLKPIDPQKNNGKICEYPMYDITTKDSNKINIYNKEIEESIGKLNNLSNKTESEELKNKIKEINNKIDKLLSNKKILIENNKKLNDNIKKKYETYLKNINSNNPEKVEMKNYIKIIIQNINNIKNKLN